MLPDVAVYADAFGVPNKTGFCVPARSRRACGLCPAGRGMSAPCPPPPTNGRPSCRGAGFPPNNRPRSVHHASETTIRSRRTQYYVNNTHTRTLFNTLTNTLHTHLHVIYTNIYKYTNTRTAHMVIHVLLFLYSHTVPLSNSFYCYYYVFFYRFILLLFYLFIYIHLLLLFF